MATNKYGNFPAKQIYLVYGNNETEVNNTRYELVTSILTPEERDAGLTEIRSAGNQPLTLDGCLSEIIGELGTSSFIGDSKRVVVVYDLKDFFEARAGGRGKKPAKASAKPAAGSNAFATIAEWFRSVLPTTENIVVFVCQENDEKQRTVSEGAELLQLCMELGHVVVKRDKALNFEFEDFVYSRNATAAITLLRHWIRRGAGDSTTRSRIYNTLTNIIELAFQARCLAEAKADGLPATQVAVEGFPSLGRLPDWKAKKVHTFAAGMSLEKIRSLVEQANRLQTIMYPTGEEDYVPDWEEYIETLTLQLTMR